jgi:hypothetical protein
MDRVDKCNALIDRELGYLSHTPRLHWQSMLQDHHDRAEDEGEAAICALVNKSHELCLRIADLNCVANANLKRRRDDLKEQLKGMKKNGL